MTGGVGRTRVKICGITRIDDAWISVDHGADALGFVFHEPSRRFIDPIKAKEIIEQLPPFIQTIGVFADETADIVVNAYTESGVDGVQCMNFSGPFPGIPPSSIIPVVRVGEGSGGGMPSSIPEERTVLLDTFVPGEKGGTGRTFDWDIAKQYAKARRIIVAGGLSPENVCGLIERVAPFGVDVSSGVETSPGKKDHEKIARFFKRVRAADEHIRGA
jgi:phosphoribosylanthranilate isomerase